MITIAYLEPDASSRDDLIIGLKALFSECGLPADVKEIKNPNEVIADARNGRIDIFVSDLSLNTDGPLGLNLLSDVKGKMS